MLSGCASLSSGGFGAQVVIVNDRMQRGYSYERVAPAGENFDAEFRPHLTPAEMLRLGVFCGKYMTDCRDEFPADWFVGAKLASGRRDCALNYFGVDASQTCRCGGKRDGFIRTTPAAGSSGIAAIILGRRLPQEDARQIGRWRAMRRHVRQIERNCEPGDPMCRPRQRQALLHWAYDSRTI